MEHDETALGSLGKILVQLRTARKFSLALAPLIFVTVLQLMSHKVEATNKFWIAAGPGNFNDNANWSLSSGGPNNTTAPGASDVPFFDAGGVGNCTISANANVQGFNIVSGYTGTIAVASGSTLTITGGFSQFAGTFNGGNSNIDVDGNFLITGTGVFNSTSGTLFLGIAFDHNTVSNPGGTFNHNNGTVTFDGEFGGINSNVSGTVFNNVNFDQTDQKIVFSRSGGGPTITVTGALALNDGKLFGDGQLSGSLIEARASVTVSPNFEGAPSSPATLVIANGSGARTLTFAAGANLINVSVNDANATIQTSATGTLNWRTLTLQAGTINQGGVDFSFVPNGQGNYSQTGGTFNGSANSIAFQSQFSQSGGTFNGGSGNVDVDGNFLLQGTGVFSSTTGTLFLGRGFDHDTVSFPGGTFNHNNGTVIIDGDTNASLNLPAGGEIFNNLTFTLPDLGQRNLSGGPFIALGALTLNNGTLFNGTLQPRGNVVIAGTFDGGSGTTVTFSGSNNQTLTNSGGPNPTGTWTVNKAAGSVTLLSDLTLGTSQSLMVTSGKLDLGPSFNLTAGSITIAANGALRNFGSGDLTLGSGLTNNGVFNFNGGTTSCGDPDPILIRSSSSGAARPWSGSGAFSIVDVDVQDQNAAGVAGGIPAFNSTNSGNNTSWTFNSGCSVELTTQPMSQSVCPNISVSFTVAASGTGLTFQWRKNGVNLANGGNISGATTTTLTINPVGPSDHASYDVVVTNTFGVTAASVAATLTVAGVVTTTADSGAGSLRQAILDVNSCPGFNTIAFSIPASGVQTITPLSALPAITEPVIIDGTTQPGFTGAPLVELNGSSAGTVSGLQVNGGSSTVRGLIINRFNLYGIEISVNGGNLVEGCYLGTNAAGTAGLLNFEAVHLASPNNVVGGTTTAKRNIISANVYGVRIIGNNANNNQIRGNFIGTDVTGTQSLGNSIGVSLEASNNVIGGTTAQERNIISGNSTGIDVSSSSNSVKGNFIGTDVSGLFDLGNLFGVILAGGLSSNNIIGGTTSGERNIISGNSESGVIVSFSNSNQVKGNFIGTDVTGTQALGNGDGIRLNTFASNNLIGGTSVADSNVISGNSGSGVIILSGTGNQLKGNFIGTDLTDTMDLGNTGVGVEINGFNNNSASSNQIGGTAPGEGNTIAFNARGVFVTPTDIASNNSIRGNSIFDNDNLGIDLNPVGVTPNDAGDGDTGPNKLQNFPSILSANSDGASITIQTTLSSTPNSFFNIDFYSSPTVDSSGFGEGKVYLGSRPAATQDDGQITFTATFNAVVTLGHFITATATDLAGNTSEFSLAQVVSDAAACATLELMPTSASFNDAGGSGLLNVTKAAGCAWTAVSNAPWITNVAPASGSGNGPVSYMVAANSSGCRSGTITVGGRTFTVVQSCPTDIELVSFIAETYDSGTFIQWNTGYEADNLGFNIYREEQGKRKLVNSQLVAGSALTAGSTLRAGESYAWWDAMNSDCGSPNAGCKNAAYWLEDIDLKGQSTWHGPFDAKSVGGKPPDRSRALLLGEIGKSSKNIPQTSSVEARAIADRLTPAQFEKSAGIAATAAVKLSIRREGLYRITQPELVAAGLDPHVDPRRLQLFADGIQQRIIVSGEEDGRFDPTDGIEFYGFGLDSPFTDSRIYYALAGQEAGLRVQQFKNDAPPSGAHSFTHTVERRDRSIYFAALRNGERENFFGAVIAQNPVDQTLTLAHVGASPSNAQLEVILQGVTLTSHRVSIQLNEISVGEVTFGGQSQGIALLSVPHTQLREGANLVRLTAIEGPSDVSLLDYIRISYQHTFTADNNSLKLTAPGNQSISVEGFSNKSIRVLDVTERNAPKEILGDVEETKSGYRVRFAPTATGTRTLLVSATEQSPSRIWFNSPSSLRELNTDLLIITTAEMRETLGPLTALRIRQGLSVSIVDIEDIYDEFSLGQKSPIAIKEFLSFANSLWKNKPRFVLFAGDASYDPKNYLGYGDVDLVPTRLIETDYLETASDEWFSDFNEDGIADIPTGRLPARTREALSLMLKKIIGYEGAGRGDEVLLVADANDGNDFEAVSNELTSMIPSALRTTQVNRGRLEPEKAKNCLLEAIYRKHFLVNYVGHGSVNQWRGNLLTNEDAQALRNEHLPLFVMMTCLNGYFDDPVLDSLGEALLKTEGGGVAVWASSGMTLPHEQALVNQELFRLLFDGSSRLTIGEAVMRAKAKSNSADVRRTWILLGDPSMKLK